MTLPLAVPAANRPKRLFRLHPEQRRIARVRVAVGGRVMLENRQEYAATTLDATIASLGMRCEAQARLGEKVIGYFDTIGRVEGAVARVWDQGFAIDLQTTTRKRDRLANQLVWLANRDILNLPEDRRHDRIVPLDPRVTLTRLDDPLKVPLRGNAIDLSRSGAAIATAERFVAGEDIVIGTTPARVIRAFEGGIAVEFRAPIPEGLFSTDIRL